MKFASKLIRYYPPHLRHVATLLWEIKISYFLQVTNYIVTNNGHIIVCPMQCMVLDRHKITWVMYVSVRNTK